MAGSIDLAWHAEAYGAGHDFGGLGLAGVGKDPPAVGGEGAPSIPVVVERGVPVVILAAVVLGGDLLRRIRQVELERATLDAHSVPHHRAFEAVAHEHVGNPELAVAVAR